MLVPKEIGLDTARVYSEIVKECPCGTIVVRHKDWWWECWMETIGHEADVPIPSRVHTCDQVNSLPKTEYNFWNLVKDPYMCSSMLHRMFIRHRPLPENWFNIFVDGSTSYRADIHVPRMEAIKLISSLTQWYELEKGPHIFSLCNVPGSRVKCRGAGFKDKLETEGKGPMGCPLAKCYNSEIRKWSDCHTAFCEGVAFVDIEDDISRGELSDPRWKTWMATMLNFLNRYVGDEE